MTERVYLYDSTLRDGAQTQGVFAFDAYTGALKGSIGDVASDWGLPFALSADESLIAIAGEDRTPRD